MGGSKSKSVIDSVQEQITNVAMQVVQDCMVSSSQSQVVSSSNAGWQLGSSIKVLQQTDVSSTCFQDTNKQASLQNQIQQIIKNTASAEGVGLTSVVGASTSSAEVKLRTIIQNNVNMSNIQKNYNIIKQDQQVTLTNTQSGVQFMSSVDISQGATVFAAATLKAVDSTGILNSLAVAIDQQSSAKTTNPLDFLANIIGSVTGAISTVWIVIGLALVAVFGIIVFVLFGDAGGSSGPEVGQEGEQSEAEVNPEGEQPEPSTNQ